MRILRILSTLEQFSDFLNIFLNSSKRGNRGYLTGGKILPRVFLPRDSLAISPKVCLTHEVPGNFTPAVFGSTVYYCCFWRIYSEYPNLCVVAVRTEIALDQFSLLRSQHEVGTLDRYSTLQPKLHVIGKTFIFKVSVRVDHNLGKVVKNLLLNNS